MSSVTRFIKQNQLAATYYSAAVVAATPATYCYEFVPSATNTVGNYPPGYMQTASALLQAAINQAVNAAGAAGNLILRDMGKTIQAPVSSLTGSVGFFRQVQLLSPALAASFVGGSTGLSFGVLGTANTPDAYTDFLVFYVPVVVGGVSGQAASTALALPSACGQL
jgi:hypothetical protein